MISEIQENPQENVFGSTIAMGCNEEDYLLEGWNGVESSDKGVTFRWTKDKARCRFYHNKESKIHILLRSAARTLNKSVQLKISLNQNLLADINFDNNEWQLIKLDLPEELPSEEIILCLEVTPTWRPAEVFQASQDDRLLGVAIAGLRIF